MWAKTLYWVGPYRVGDQYGLKMCTRAFFGVLHRYLVYQLDPDSVCYQTSFIGWTDSGCSSPTLRQFGHLLISIELSVSVWDGTSFISNFFILWSFSCILQVPIHLLSLLQNSPNHLKRQRKEYKMHKS